ncbi:hypothetical protein HaLaN_32838 [Haematococcus lacustris]|uniref:Uncharacterized protein n=1 Tax=Haematococcus lacustris TaxID=44745 RepID=A0A6A0AMI0_HAELA|nr:hypothetical protein HaLaN_32838 [Haematococcus lacustris]
MRKGQKGDGWLPARTLPVTPHQPASRRLPIRVHSSAQTRACLSIDCSGRVEATRNTESLTKGFKVAPLKLGVPGP